MSGWPTQTQRKPCMSVLRQLSQVILYRWACTARVSKRLCGLRKHTRGSAGHRWHVHTRLRVFCCVVVQTYRGAARGVEVARKRVLVTKPKQKPIQKHIDRTRVHLWILDISTTRTCTHNTTHRIRRTTTCWYITKLRKILFVQSVPSILSEIVTPSSNRFQHQKKRFGHSHAVVSRV